MERSPRIWSALAFNALCVGGTWCVFVWMSLTGFAVAQETGSPLDSEGRLVNFSKDIAPIFAKQCGECHLGDKPKADFSINDADTVSSYLTPGDADDSMLYVDYLVTDDPDMLMPPASHGGPLSTGELALIRTWINEGADWPEDAIVGSEEAEVVDTEDVGTPEGAAPFLPEPYNRYWEFQGYFHPAVVHFPIALLTVGAMFVVLGWVWPKVGTQIPLACLLIGAASSIVACAMGWAFADEQGYPNYSAGWDKEITPHRWSGMIVAGLASFMSVLAIVGVSKERQGLNFLWKSGLLALAVMVGLVGHQGGELTYGKEHYQKAFAKLQVEESVSEEPVSEEPVSEEPASEEPASEEPASEEPASEEPASEEPASEEPASEEPASEEPVSEEPVSEEPVSEEPASEEPASEEPASEEPVSEEPVSEEPVSEEPVSEEPVSEEPVSEEPASEEPVS